MPHLVRRTLAELTMAPRAARGLAMLAALLAVSRASALAAPSAAPVRAPHTPATAVHTEFMVETNHLGQVTRVRSGVSSKDLAFNAMTYGNALQAFIRTERGRAVAGTFRLDYDYNPRSKVVKRSVALVRAGGVNPNAPGAVTVEAQKLAKESRKAKPGATPSSKPLPDLEAITGRGH